MSYRPLYTGEGKFYEDLEIYKLYPSVSMIVQQAIRPIHPPLVPPVATNHTEAMLWGTSVHAVLEALGKGKPAPALAMKDSDIREAKVCAERVWAEIQQATVFGPASQFEAPIGYTVAGTTYFCGAPDVLGISGTSCTIIDYKMSPSEKTPSRAWVRREHEIASTAYRMMVKSLGKFRRITCLYVYANRAGHTYIHEFKRDPVVEGVVLSALNLLRYRWSEETAVAHSVIHDYSDRHINGAVDEEPEQRILQQQLHSTEGEY